MSEQQAPHDFGQPQRPGEPANWWQDIDLDEDFPLPPLAINGQEPEAPIVPDEMAAERHLKAVARCQAEEAGVRAHAKAHRDRIALWEAGHLRQIMGRQSWHESGLRVWFRALGRKSIKLVYGTVKTVKGKDSVEVIDEEAFQKWAKTDEAVDLVRVKREPKKNEIKAWIEGDGRGVVPPGLDLKTGEDTIKIDAR